MFFSGFALQDEASFFLPYLKTGSYNVAGFSYGATKAFEAVQSTPSRIDLLQLFSPAFFQEADERYIRIQLRGYQKNAEAYEEMFMQNIFKPHVQQKVTKAKHTLEDLQRLLKYRWSPDTLQALCDRGVKIEVYLGSEDQITDVQAAYAFFKPYATVTLIKGANHFLLGA